MKPGRRRTKDQPARVLLIGWDAADWQLIHPLIERGLMPSTAALMGAGAWGNLATTRPILSPILWNTIATGKRAADHGVHGFTEPNAEGAGVQPVSSTSRRCKAIWNILTQNQMRSNVVGWYASHPAEPINGVMVSNQFEVFTGDSGEPSAVTDGTIHPDAWTERLAPFRVLPSEIDAAAILPFVPNAPALIQKDTNRLGKLQQMLAQTSTIHAVATYLMANTEWDFTAIYYEGIDRFGHEFMPFHPPKLEHVSQEDFDSYRFCMEGIYRFHDMLLDSLLQLAGEDTAVILISDHGYYNNHLRPDPREGKSDPVQWHRPFGVLAGKGPGIRPGSRMYGASILDIAPTLLHLLNLPAGLDMPGRVLAEGLQRTQPPARIPSWEEVDGDCGMHAASSRASAEDSSAVMRQLVALGYIEAPPDDAMETVRQTVASNRFNLAQSFVDAGQFREAIEVLEKLDETLRKAIPVQMLLLTCLLGIDDRLRARVVLDALVKADVSEPRIHLMMGTLEFAEGNSETALEHLQLAAKSQARLPGLHNKLGEVYLSVGCHQQAIDAFEVALSIDAESPVAFAGLAQAKLDMGDAQGALDSALIAAELVHHFPRVHYVIGKALMQLDDYQGAVEALELCVKQAPGMQKAQETLAGVYRMRGDTQKAIAAQLRASGISI